MSTLFQGAFTVSKHAYNGIDAPVDFHVLEKLFGQKNRQRTKRETTEVGRAKEIKVGKARWESR